MSFVLLIAGLVTAAFGLLLAGSEAADLRRDLAGHEASWPQIEGHAALVLVGACLVLTAVHAILWG